MGTAGTPSPAAGGAALPQQRGAAPRERGWGSLLTALATFLLVPATPLVRTLVPIEQTWVLLLPALAACTLVGWRAGGRFALAALWTALALWVLVRPMTGAGGEYDRLARGWAFLLAGAFGAVFVLGTRPRFFSVALSAVALTLAASLALAVPSSDGPARLEGAIVRELASRDQDFVSRLDSARSLPENAAYLGDNPEQAEALKDAAQSFRALPARAAVIVPAMLALESLAALALAWALYHRMSRVRIGAPLGSLKQFRFNDHLIWGLIAGVVVLVLPSLAELRVVGLNLVLFFGSLFALRGVGIVSYFVSPGRLGGVSLAIVAVLFWPLSTVGALGLGLGDTWLDWRRPRTPTS